jgi:hypothetical protein
MVREKTSSSDAIVSLACTLSGTPTNGVFTMSLTAAQMRLFILKHADGQDIKATKFVYDVYLTYSDNTIRKLLQGSFEVSPAVTR